MVSTKLWNDDQGHDRTRFVPSTRACAGSAWTLTGDGRVRAIGVSNFQVAHLQRLLDETSVVNPVELHTRLQQEPPRRFHAAHGIVTEAWSPLGQGRALQDPTIVKLARRHGRTPAQVVLRWHLQRGNVVIPSRPARRGSGRTSRCSTSS